ncbi:hypothetical protein EKO27_g8300 [Xylaria grammica]|uniref:Mago nashi protein n=1 Tax=Xylaria grammica TaxID=363999 RepID=A0A439CX80_9PEZI|nr:hypothetical protein EKO27_g8300 [Xylaria grammica]
MASSNDSFYIRYYSGHSGRFGHEFLEFDFRVVGDGRSAVARYANNSNYRNDSLIRKRECAPPSVSRSPFRAHIPSQPREAACSSPVPVMNHPCPREKEMR